MTTPGVNDQPGTRHDWNSVVCWSCCAATGAAASSAVSAAATADERARRCGNIGNLLLDDDGVAGLELRRLALVVVAQRVLVVELQPLRAAQDGDVLAVGEVGEAA